MKKTAESSNDDGSRLEMGMRYAQVMLSRIEIDAWKDEMIDW